MNYPMIVAAGLLAGATTCAVTQGGLLMGLITRQRKAAPARPKATSRSATLTDDLTPVTGFLVGKLISHTALGAALGALGGAIGYNARLGAAAQLLAGILMTILGLGALGVPGLREIKFTPPTSWLGIVRKSTRSQSAAAPFLLGLAVIAVPCGVTISMEVLAATSGSALTGGLVMALFVLGTAPMFTLYGYLSQRVQLGNAMGLGLGAVVVVLGLLTVNAGLVASGSPVSFQALLTHNAATTTALPPAANASPDSGAEQTLVINATSGGYQPSEVTARSGTPIRLRFHTSDTRSCILATTLPTLGKQILLPSTGDGDIEVGLLPPGEYPISCSMGMYTATLLVTG